MSVKTSKIFNSLNLVPKINSVSLETRSKSYIAINLQIDSKFDKTITSWLKDPEVIKFLDLRILVCVDETARNQLLESPEGIFTAAPNKFLHIADIRMDSGQLNLQKTINDEGNIFLSKMINQSFILENTDISYLSIFVAVSLNKEQIAQKHLIPLGSINEIIGTFDEKVYLSNGKIIDNKLQLLSLSKIVEKLNFIKLPFENNKFDSANLQVLLQAQAPPRFFSDLLVSQGAQGSSLLFVVNVKNIFENKSSYAGLFANKSFRDMFFEKPLRPEKIRITRHNVRTKTSEQILDQKFSSSIDTKKCLLNEVAIHSKNNTLFSISVLDRASKTLNDVYQYEVELEFADKTIQYIDSIQVKIKKFKIELEQIMNFIFYNNLYDVTLNKISPRFFQTVSMSKYIKDLSEILSQLMAFSEVDLDNLVTMSTSENMSLQLIELALDIYKFLDGQLGNLKQTNGKFASSYIIVEKKFPTPVELGQSVKTFSVISGQRSKILPKITVIDFKKRINREISKYYQITDIVNKNKVAFLTPESIQTRNFVINQSEKTVNSFSSQEYNNLMIDSLFDQSIFSPKNKDMNVYLLDIFKSNSISVEYGRNKSNQDSDRERALDARTSRNKKFVSVAEDHLPVFDNLLLSILIKTLIVKDQKLDKYNTITNLTTKEIDELPIQLKSIVDSLNENKFVQKNLTLSDLEDFNNFFKFWFNFKQLFQLKYLDLSNFSRPEWRTFDENFLTALAQLPEQLEIICKIEPYYRSDLDIIFNEVFDFKCLDEIFVLQNIGKYIDVKIDTQNSPATRTVPLARPTRPTAPTAADQLKIAAAKKPQRKTFTDSVGRKMK